MDSKQIAEKQMEEMRWFFDCIGKMNKAQRDVVRTGLRYLHDVKIEEFTEEEREFFLTVFTAALKEAAGRCG